MNPILQYLIQNYAFVNYFPKWFTAIAAYRTPNSVAFRGPDRPPSFGARHLHYVNNFNNARTPTVSGDGLAKIKRPNDEQHPRPIQDLRNLVRHPKLALLVCHHCCHYFSYYFYFQPK